MLSAGEGHFLNVFNDSNLDFLCRDSILQALAVKISRQRMDDHVWWHRAPWIHPGVSSARVCRYRLWGTGNAGLWNFRDWEAARMYKALTACEQTEPQSLVIRGLREGRETVQETL